MVDDARARAAARSDGAVLHAHDVMRRYGEGATTVPIGVAMLAPTLAPPFARVLGWPATKVGGAPGALARGNSIRNPSGTASTASALMIGVTLVTPCRSWRRP